MKKEICPDCERGYLQRKKVPYFLYGEKVGEFAGEVCTACKSEFLNEEQDAAIERKVKELGLWSLATETRVRQSGNSLSITLPKKIQQFLNIKRGREILVTPVDRHTIQVRVA